MPDSMRGHEAEPASTRTAESRGGASRAHPGAPDRDAPDRDAPDRDALETVVAPLLADHPEAVFYAIGADGIIVPMPESVRLPGGRVLPEATSALDMVVPSDRSLVIDAWERVRKTGLANAHVMLLSHPDSRAALYFIDATAHYGVYLGVFTWVDGGDGDPASRLAQHAPPRPPRFARVRKNELAVVLEIDEAFTQILGWEPDEIVGTRTLEIVHPDDQVLAVDNWMDMLARRGPGRRVRLRHHHRDGSWVWIEVTNHNLLEDPEQQCVVAEMVDISDEMAAHEALREREQLLARLAETIPIGLLQVDSDGRVVYTNDRLHSMVGIGRARTVEEQLSTIVDEDRELVRDAFSGVLSNAIDTDIEVRHRRFGDSDKEVGYLALNLRALTNESGGVTGAIVCLTDVTEAARAREELSARANYDEVTGCHNRSSTMAHLESAVSGTDMNRRPAVIFIDLDRFKEINDLYGHSVGDGFLRVVGERLHSCVRSEDVVGRIGGDEFLVICPRISSTEEAMNTARRLAAGLRHPIRLTKGAVPSRASIGVAWSPRTDIGAETLVAQADAAMYRAKRTGGGDPVLFEPSRPGEHNTRTWSWPTPPDDR